MPARLSGVQGDPNTNRSEGIRVIALSLETEAYELLPELAPSKRAYGQYISRLIHEDRARREERARVKAELAHVLSGKGLQ